MKLMRGNDMKRARMIKCRFCDWQKPAGHESIFQLNQHVRNAHGYQWAVIQQQIQVLGLRELSRDDFFDRSARSE